MDKIKALATVKNIFIVALVFIAFILGKCENKEKIVTKNKYHFKTDTVVVNKTKEVVVKIKGKETRVDSLIYVSYEKEKDTTKKKEIFIESIAINEYNTKLIDNDSITLNVYSKTQGKLIESSADIKFNFKKEKIITRPRLSLVIGADIGFYNSNLLPRINAGIQTKSGNIYSAHLDSNGNYYLGFSKSLDLIK